MSERLMSLYERLVLKRPLLVLAAVLAVIGWLATYLPQLELDASADSLVLEGDESLDYFRKINKRYATEEFLLVTYRPQGDLMSDDTLRDIAALRDELAALPGVSSVNSILDVPLLQSPRVSLSQVTAGNLPTLRDPEVDRQLALEEFTHSPLYRSLLTSPDGQTTAIQVNLERDERYFELLNERDALREKAKKGELSEAQEEELEQVEKVFTEYKDRSNERTYALVEQVRDILGKYRDDATVFLGGVPMIAADMISFIQSDLLIFGSGIVVFIVLLLAVIFRNAVWVLLPLGTCLLSALFMLGLLPALGWRLTVISSNFVALLLIVTLAISVHLVVRYRELAHKGPGESQYALVRETVRQMAKPCFYTAATTLVAFVSLVVSDIRPVIDFGWMMSMGVTVALVLTFIVLPAVLVLFRRHVSPESGDNSKAFTMRFAGVADRHGPAIFAVSGALLLVSLWGISRLEVENRFIDYFHEDTEIYQGMEVIDEQLGGTIPLDIIIDAPEQEAPAASGEDDFSDDFGGFDDDFGDTGQQQDYWFTVAGMARISQVHDYVDGLQETGKVLSLATLYDLIEIIMGDGVDDLQLALVQRSLPEQIEGILVDPYYSPEHQQVRINVRVMETSRTLKRQELLVEVRDHLVNELGFAEDKVHLTGMLVLYNNMLQSLYRSQILTLSAVFFAILAMFLVLFRSLRLALIALAPNLLAAGAVLGGMGLFGIPLDMMTITIAAITIGIGVDHAIHYVHRFRVEFPQDRDYRAAMFRCHGSIGKAMYYTAVTIIFGFSILALSNFTPSIYFGLLTGGAMLAAMLGSLLLLPRLILLFKPLGPEQED